MKGYNLSQMSERCAALIARCRRQRETMRLERETLRMAANLRDHERIMSQWEKSRKEVEMATRRLIESAYLKRVEKSAIPEKSASSGHNE